MGEREGGEVNSAAGVEEGEEGAEEAAEEGEEGEVGADAAMEAAEAEEIEEDDAEMEEDDGGLTAEMQRLESEKNEFLLELREAIPLMNMANLHEEELLETAQEGSHAISDKYEEIHQELQERHGVVKQEMIQQMMSGQMQSAEDNNRIVQQMNAEDEACERTFDTLNKVRKQMKSIKKVAKAMAEMGRVPVPVPVPPHAAQMGVPEMGLMMGVPEGAHEMVDAESGDMQLAHASKASKKGRYSKASSVSTAATEKAGSSSASSSSSTSAKKRSSAASSELGFAVIASAAGTAEGSPSASDVVKDKKVKSMKVAPTRSPDGSPTAQSSFSGNESGAQSSGQVASKKKAPSAPVEGLAAVRQKGLKVKSKAK